MANTNQDFISKYKWPIIIGVIALVIFGSVAGMYNNFVRMDQSVNAEWSEVNNQYGRQAELIPNLVSTVSSAVKIETKFVTDVTEARSRWQTSKTTLEKDESGAQMTNAVTTFVNAVMTTENYPVLQANKQYTALMDELIGTQNRIATARGRYIDAIKIYNIGVKSFPANVLAGMFGYAEKEYYASPMVLVTPLIGTGTLP